MSTCRPKKPGSWGEFRARLECELADPGSLLVPLGRVLAALLFAAALFSCAYATQDRSLWLWLVMLASLGVLAARAVARADRRRARETELGRLHDAWLDHLERCSPRR